MWAQPNHVVDQVSTSWRRQSTSKVPRLLSLFGIWEVRYVSSLSFASFMHTSSSALTHGYALAGQREFVNMLPLVCNDAVAILFMFDLTRTSTLNSIKEWYRQARGTRACVRVRFALCDRCVCFFPVRCLCRSHTSAPVLSVAPCPALSPSKRIVLTRAFPLLCHSPRKCTPVRSLLCAFTLHSYTHSLLRARSRRFQQIRYSFPNWHQVRPLCQLHTRGSGSNNEAGARACVCVCVHARVCRACALSSFVVRVSCLFHFFASLVFSRFGVRFLLFFLTIIFAIFFQFLVPCVAFC